MKKAKLPRIPGFKYAPVMREVEPFNRTNFRVQQAAFWMGGGACGPVKSTPAEAIKAWQRLVRNIKKGMRK